MKLEISAVLLFVAVASASHNLIVRRDTLGDKADNLLLLIKDITFLEPYINDAYNCNKNQMDKVRHVVAQFAKVRTKMYNSNGTLRVNEKYLDDATKNAEAILKTFTGISTLKGLDKYQVADAADYVDRLMKNGISKAKILPQVNNVFSETKRAVSALAVITALQYLLPHYYKKQNCDQEVRKLYKDVYGIRKIIEKGLKDNSITHSDVDKYKPRLEAIVETLDNALG